MEMISDQGCAVQDLESDEYSPLIQVRQIFAYILGSGGPFVVNNTCLQYS